MQRAQPEPVQNHDALLLDSGIYADFGPSELWLQTDPDIAIDLSKFGARSSSLRMSSTNGSPARADSLLGAPPTRLLQVDVYVEDPASCARFDLLLTNNEFTGWIAKSGLQPAFVTGWNYLQFSIDDCAMDGSGMTLADWDTVNKVRFAFCSQPGTTASIWVRRVQWLKTRAALTFTWDDGRAGCYTDALPILSQYGWASTIYVIPQAVGQPSFALDGGGTLPDPLTLDQLYGLQDAGWDISSHTYSHPDLSSIPADQQQYQLEATKEWLVANGFSRGARFFATPYGKKNADTMAIASTLYENLRDGSSSPNSGFETPFSSNWAQPTRYGLRFQEIQSLNRTPLAKFQSWVDSAIASGTWLIILGHTVDGPSGWLDPMLFSDCVAYVDSRRDQIDVLTMSQYWDRRNRTLRGFPRNQKYR